MSIKKGVAYVLLGSCRFRLKAFVQVMTSLIYHTTYSSYFPAPPFAVNLIKMLFELSACAIVDY